MVSNYYELLGCDSSATYEELKKSYQTLIKKHHPDKRSVDEPTDEKFIEIDEAWKVLRDSHSRRMYDAQLMQMKNDGHVIYAEMYSNELNYVDEDGVYTYGCRCGGTYLVNNEDNDESLVVQCDECSLCLLVNFNK